MSKVCEIVTAEAEKIAQKLGLYLVDVEYVKAHNGMNLNIYIGKKGGVTLNDTTDFSREIDPILDEIDISNGKPYTLNVSSPGLDRKFKTTKDFENAIGEVVEIKLFSKIGKTKVVVGKLLEANEESVLVEGFEKLDRKNIASASFYIDFNFKGEKNDK